MPSQGDNFGLNPNYDYYEIYLDSYDANSTNDASYYYADWPLFQLVTPIPNLAAIKVLEVQIPFSWYVFHSKNNTFLLTEGGSTSTVTIPVGNYNSTTMSTALGVALTSASPNAYTYNVTFSGQNSTPSTSKFTITSSAGSAFTLTFGVDGDDLGNTNPRLWLGFTEYQNISSGSGVLVAPNAANIAGPNYLYINSRALGTLLKSVLPKGAEALGAGSIGPQIAKIPISVQPGGVIYWSDPDPEKWFSLENLALITQFDLYLTVGNNDNPTVTSLNGLNFSIKLGILQNRTIFGNVDAPAQGYPQATVMSRKRRG